MSQEHNITVAITAFKITELINQAVSKGLSNGVRADDTLQLIDAHIQRIRAGERITVQGPDLVKEVVEPAPAPAASENASTSNEAVENVAAGDTQVQENSESSS